MMADTNAKEIGPAAFPVLRYRNLPAAIDWLCNAFGFERHHVTVGNDGTIQFAQLTFGKTMIMATPVRASAFDKLLRQPDEVGGAETQVCYFFVADAHAHCARATAAGAQIVFDVKHSGNGGRTYSCRDPEGHLWNFGTYDPWKHQSVAQLSQYRRPLRPATYAIILAALLLTVSMIVMPLGGVVDRDERTPSKFGEIITGSTERDKVLQPASERVDRDESATARAAAEAAALEAQRQLTVVQLEREVLRKAAADSHNQLMQALDDKKVAEQLAKQAQEKLDRALSEAAAFEAQRQFTTVQLEREELRKAATDSHNQLMQALDDKKVAEQLAKHTQEKLDRALAAKTGAERSAKDARRQLAVERANRAAESANQAKQAAPFPW
jgi:uncharacterized glyoxalase superfamily protein PhnB